MQIFKGIYISYFLETPCLVCMLRKQLWDYCYLKSILAKQMLTPFPMGVSAGSKEEYAVPNPLNAPVMCFSW
jgi:hypothetical protein